MVKAFRPLLAVILLGACALVASANLAVASNQVTLRVTFTDVNPVTGLATGDPDATGTAVLKFYPHSGKLCYKIKLQGLAAPTEPAPGLGDAHIHAVSDGSIVVDLKADFQKADGFYIATGCVSVSTSQIADILADPTAYYLNVHNVPYPGGALFAVL